MATKMVWTWILFSERSVFNHILSLFIIDENKGIHCSETKTLYIFAWNSSLLSPKPDLNIINTDLEFAPVKGDSDGTKSSKICCNTPEHDTRLVKGSSLLFYNCVLLNAQVGRVTQHNSTKTAL